MTKHVARIAIGLSAALLAAAALGVSTAAAKTPNWVMAVDQIPATVSPGAYAGFKVTITNNGPSNMAQLYFTASPTQAPFSVTPSTGCNSTGQLDCSLGALRAGASVTLVVVYATPTTGTSFPVTFQANTTGVTFSDGGTSHGDTLSQTVSTALNASGNFAGGYVVDPNNPISTGGGDNQQTTVDPPTSGIGVTITETGSGNPCGSAHPIGQLSTINVGNGAPFSPFLMTLTIQASSLPSELLLSQVKLCHQYDNGTAVVLPRCASDAAQATPCVWPKWGGASHPDGEEHPTEDDADNHGLLILDVWDTQNGSLRGAY